MHMDERLQHIAALVRRGSRVADIGTDHAYLPVFLVQNGICPSAIAGDIGQGPAANARKTVERAGLQRQIEVRIGNGLSVLTAEEADDIVIAGMGGETVAAILEQTPWVRDPRLRLILQPMTHPEQARAFLLQNGFSLLREETVLSAGRRYLITVATFTDAPPPPIWRYYTGILHPQREREFLLRQLAWVRARARGLQAEGNAAAEQYTRLVKDIEQYLEGDAI